MSLPTDHMTKLETSIQAHERRIQELSDVIELAHEEIVVHETIVGLARNERIITTISRCYGDDQFAAGLLQAPATGLANHGIDLPNGVEMIDPPAARPAARLQARLRHRGWDVTLVWDRTTGFSAVPDTRRLRLLSAAVVDPRPVGPGQSATHTPR
jgi:hypothetical protein